MMDDQVAHNTNLINGTWHPATSGLTLPAICPSDGIEFNTIDNSSHNEIDSAVYSAREAFEIGTWSKLTATERGRLLLNLSELINEQHESLAQLEAKDTGKPISQARADITSASRYFEFYGGAADKIHGEIIPYLNGFHVQSLREPLGVTGHIIPWNYPAQMFGRTLAPSLAVGNAVILKPAEEASMTPIRLAKLAMESGFPEGSINVVTGIGENAGQALASNPDIDFISFTGSPEVGTIVQSAAAENHIGCTLELGGKSPQIIFEDADLESSLQSTVKAIVQNGGQTCSAGSRALIQKSIFKPFIEKLAGEFNSLIAAPHNEDGDLGALISKSQKQRVEQFLLNAPCEPLAKGKIADTAPKEGYYVEPTLFGEVDPSSPIFQEEVFGPVLVCLPFESESEAIKLANATQYGLVAGVWTQDGGRQTRMAKSLRCGQVFINCFGAGGGIELPFGGVGKSGHGREKGFAALYEFTQLKTVIQNHQ